MLTCVYFIQRMNTNTQLYTQLFNPKNTVVQFLISIHLTLFPQSHALKLQPLMDPITVDKDHGR